MYIKHINNSFFEIKTKVIKMVCDPWVGMMRDTGTWSYPNIRNNKSILNKIEPQIIYISHLHTDHFDEEILKNYKNKKTKFIIKKFKDSRLKKKIIKLGYKNIKEIDPWKTFKYKNLELTIIPCDYNSAEFKSKIFYDLDTSILIYDHLSKTCFYNNVDNPLNLKSIKKIFNFSKQKYKKIDIAAVAPRSASEFPQCFLNVNRTQMKEVIIDKCLLRAKKVLQNLKIKNYIPAGGNFVIVGKYNPLQKLVAHPSNNKMENFLKTKKLKIFNIDGGGSLEIKNGEVKKVLKPNIKKFSELFASKSLTKTIYPYRKTSCDNENLNLYFYESKLNYFNILKKIGVKQNWEINFKLYKNLKLSKNGNLLNKLNFDKKFKIECPILNKKTFKLNCYLDLKLFTLLLKGNYNWNMAIGGSLIMFERYPNIFVPDIPFSLNFLKI